MVAVVGGIRRTPADAAFSKCVRERAEWACEHCGTQHAENSMGLHCSHHHGRGKWGVRFNPMNAEALCYGCHSHHGGTQRRMDMVLTEAEQQLLLERMDDIQLAKEYRRSKGKGVIAKHYREEYARMKQLRAEGVTGRIEFEEWL